MIDLKNDSLLAILGAVPFETDPLTRLFDQTQTLTSCGQTFLIGRLGNWRLIIGSTGLGKVNAAITTTALLERFPLKQVWNVGCAGAYEQGPLRVGDVLVTTESIFGDEGVLTRDHVLPSTHIGIPVVVHEGREHYDSLPLDRFAVLRDTAERTPEGMYQLTDGNPLASIARAPSPDREAGEDANIPSFRLLFGPSLTVSMASGDAETATDRYIRYGAYAENMEGSAVAQACFRFNTPVLECRGISNAAGKRDKVEWELEKAITHCHGVLAHWLRMLTLSRSIEDGRA